MKAILRVLKPGPLASFQDEGRTGGKRYGIPPGGAMDRQAATAANLLVGNEPGTTTIEILLHGCAFEVLADTWLSVAGADADSTPTSGTARFLRKGEIIEWKQPRNGVWSYLAVPGGWSAETFWGSTSVSSRGEFGSPLAVDDILFSEGEPILWPDQIAARRLPSSLRFDYRNPPPFTLWPGPQIEWFSPEALTVFFRSPWRISARSNRIGYRLQGPTMEVPDRSLASEPVLLGSIQIPPGGEPLIILRDGPTVGGYPKPFLLDSGQISRFVQCQPGTIIRFEPVRDFPGQAATNGNIF